MFRQVDEFVLEITDAHRDRLVGSHVHDTLCEKLELSHSCVRVVLEETQADGRC